MTANARTAGGWIEALPLAAVGAGLAIMTAAGPMLHQRFGGWALVVVFVVCGAGAFAAPRLTERCDPQQALWIVLGAAVAMRLALLFVEPYLSTDIYRYVWDGRVQAAGINPYRYVPAAPELARLRDAAIFPYINRADSAVTIYPPVAQAFFLIVTRLGQSVLVMKLALLACEAAIVAGIIALLQQTGRPATGIAIYAWHPLPVWEIAGSGHVDALMCAFLVVGLGALLADRRLLAGLLITLGGLVKPTALLALPALWRPWDWRLPLLAAVIIVLAYLPYLGVGAGVIGYVPGYLEEEGLNSGRGINLLWLLEWATGPLPVYLRHVYIALSGLILLALAFKVGFRSDRSAQATLASVRWLLVVTLVLASPHYPWYFLPLVPLLVLSPSATGWVLTVGSVLLYDVINGDILPSYNVRIGVFTLATFAALIFDVVRERQKPGARA